MVGEVLIYGKILTLKSNSLVVSLPEVNTMPSNLLLEAGGIYLNFGDDN